MVEFWCTMVPWGFVACGWPPPSSPSWGRWPRRLRGSTVETSTKRSSKKTKMSNTSSTCWKLWTLMRLYFEIPCTFSGTINTTYKYYCSITNRSYWTQTHSAFIVDKMNKRKSSIYFPSWEQQRLITDSLKKTRRKKRKVRGSRVTAIGIKIRCKIRCAQINDDDGRICNYYFFYLLLQRQNCLQPLLLCVHSNSAAINRTILIMIM